MHHVFPITTNPQHQLLTDVGVITSSCGVTWYQGGLFPDSFNNITFIAEPVHNLIHADRIHPKGASFSASRVYANKEFLASKDAWFRPVQFYIGPDGALYVIDYYRQIIEHPEWMSDDVNKSGALYNGSNKGRIYRIIPEGTSRVDWVNTLKLGEATNQVLVQSLAHKNSWWRRNAQRLLSDRNDSVIPAFLKQFIDTTTSSAGMVQAMWLLHSKGTIDSSVFIKAFNHPVAGVRENAIKIAETYLKKWPSIASHLFQLKNDSDARVRYQLLCSIGSVTGPVAESTRVQLLLKDIEDKWVQLAMLTSTSGKELTTLTRTIDELSDMETPGRKLFFENCAAVIALSQNVPAIKSSIRYATTGISEKSGWWQSAIMEGLLKGFSVKGIPSAGFYQEKQQLQKLFAASTPLSIRKSAMELVKSFGAGSGKSMNALIINARKIAGDSSSDVAFREDAINLLSLDTTAGSDELLELLVQPDERESLQQLAIKVYAKKAPLKAGRFSIGVWKSMGPSLRDVAINTFFVSGDMQKLLLSALEEGKIQTGSIGWQRSVWLMNEDNPDIRNRARTLFADRVTGRSSIIKKYNEALSMEGDVLKGKEVFKINCSSCHQVSGQNGTAFGPDLASIRNRESKFIMADILDPNRSIADTYEQWTITQKRGDKISGIVASETSSAITIRTVIGGSQTIPRTEISTMEASAISAMPAGFEGTIPISEMANLLAFLKKSSSLKE